MGEFNGLALTSTGAVYAWGLDYGGELGNGQSLSTSPVTIPVLVSLPGGVKATAVSAGAGTGLALTSTGAVYGWGGDENGEIGDASTVIGGCGCRATPVQVDLPAGSSAVAASEGWSDGLATLSNGAAYGWAKTSRERLAMGRTPSKTPRFR